MSASGPSTKHCNLQKMGVLLHLPAESRGHFCIKNNKKKVVYCVCPKAKGNLQKLPRCCCIFAPPHPPHPTGTVRYIESEWTGGFFALHVQTVSDPVPPLTADPNLQILLGGGGGG